MLGAIIGDIVGSVYEFANIKTKDFPLFTQGCSITDDSILSFATADWLIHGGKAGKYYLEYAMKYPDPMGGYGSGFNCWVNNSRHLGNVAPPYNSCGNGSAMRISPVGWFANSEDAVMTLAKTSAEATHNHPQGIKGAQAVAMAIFLARKKWPAQKIGEYISRNFAYDLSMSVQQLQHCYSWRGIDGKGNGGICQESVPQAIICALRAVSFEDAVRNAISIGGDSDTLGAITGSIAEALYGIPEGIRMRAMNYLPEEFKILLKEFEHYYSPLNREYRDQQTTQSGVKDINVEYDYHDRPMYTPDNISRLRRDEIFVFGSNLQGMHGGGAARVAYRYFGAIYGQGTGRQGNSYAIPTMHGGVEAIRPYVNEFIRYAASHPELFFYVTRIGCGIAGFSDWQIAPLFASAVDLNNVCLPKSFCDILREYRHN